MPIPTLRVCGDPSCPTLTPRTYCDEHRKAKQSKARSKYVRQNYSSNWDKLSKQYRRRYPYCQCNDSECGVCQGLHEKQGQTKSRVVDHIVPVRFFASPEQANKEINIKVLCKPCHDSKTRRKDRAVDGH